MHLTIVFNFVVIIVIAQAQIVSEKKCREYARLKTMLATTKNGIHNMVGGILSKPNQFPHMVILGFGDIDDEIFWDCSGTLISERFILSSARCTKMKGIGRVGYARMGSMYTQFSTIIIEVSDIMVPSTYKPPSKYHDISLIKLAYKVPLSMNVFPACLNTEFRIDPEELSVVVYSNDGRGGYKRDALTKVDMRLYTASSCRKLYSTMPLQRLSRGVLNDVQVCAGRDSDEEQGSCEGDSGAPLQEKQGGQYYVVGITSFDEGCGMEGIPTVYTRVSAYLPWIERNVWPR